MDALFRAQVKWKIWATVIPLPRALIASDRTAGAAHLLPPRATSYKEEGDRGARKGRLMGIALPAGGG